MSLAYLSPIGTNWSKMSNRIFLFGSTGYMTPIMEAILETDNQIVGCCLPQTSEKGNWIRTFIGRALREAGFKQDRDFIYRDPFEGIELPHNLARKNGIPILPADGLNKLEFAEEVKQLAPDVVFVAGFPRLIPEKIVLIPRIGAFNFHPSMLPNYRGGTPNRWIVLNGEEETGVTVHWVDPTFDTGAIVFQKPIPVCSLDTWGAVELKVLAVLPEMTHQLINMLTQQKIPRIEQDQNLASYHRPFRGKFQVVDWMSPAPRILRQCLAVQPKSSALTYFNCSPICIWDVEVLKAFPRRGKPGVILDWTSKDEPVVVCGDGTALKICSVLYNNKIREASFLRTKYKLSVGDKLGPLSNL